MISPNLNDKTHDIVQVQELNSIPSAFYYFIATAWIGLGPVFLKVFRGEIPQLKLS